MILAIDPGLRNTGWAVMSKHGMVYDVGLIQTQRRKELRLYMDNSMWMQHIAAELWEVLSHYDNIDQVYYEAKSGSKSAKAASCMAMAQGVVAAFSVGSGAKMDSILATEVKRRLGVQKNAGKMGVADRVVEIVGKPLVGRVIEAVGKAFSRQEHIYDAVAIGLACLDREDGSE